MKKRIIFCQVWEWYGSEDFKEGRYKDIHGCSQNVREIQAENIRNSLALI